MKLTALQQQNPHLSLTSITDHLFLEFGRVLATPPLQELEGAMTEAEVPKEGNVYIPSYEPLERTSYKETIEQKVFGQMPVQIGYCNGRTHQLNALEYHKSSEVNIALTDFVLMVGNVKDLSHNRYNAKLVQYFYVPQGTAIEMYASTLHFAPCAIDSSGFRCIVILPMNTNQPLANGVREEAEGEERLLFMTNKWLLAHPERTPLLEKGAHPGILGENIKLNSLAR